MTMPFFTVIVPLYNKEQYVHRSLESIHAQTFSDYEVIIVDDGSTDSGPEIAGSYTAANWRLVRQKR